MRYFEVQNVWVWCRESCEASSVGGLGFGHSESVLTDTELELGFALLTAWKELQTGRANHENSGFFPFSSLTGEIMFLKIVV